MKRNMYVVFILFLINITGFCLKPITATGKNRPFLNDIAVLKHNESDSPFRYYAEIGNQDIYVRGKKKRVKRKPKPKKKIKQGNTGTNLLGIKK